MLLLGACNAQNSSFLHPHGVVAHNQRYWLFYICALMAIVVVPVFVMIPLFAWRYRLGAKTPYKPDWSFSWALEGMVWGVPVVIVALLAVLIIDQETRFDPFAPIRSRNRALEVEVVALNWKWLFIYPEQNVASIGTMAFPADRPVHFTMTSDKTMQSFFIPALGSQIYVMAGMVTQLNLMADGPGRFIGEDTQFNGMEFQQDRFVAHGMGEADFTQWIAAARSVPRPLDRTTFTRLARDGNVNDALGWFGADPAAAKDKLPRLEPGLQFSSVDPSLFNGVVDQYGMTAANTPPLVGPAAADTPSGMDMNGGHKPPVPKQAITRPPT